MTRNLISVDHWYAESGRWQEATFSGQPGADVGVAKIGDLKQGHMKLVHVNGRRIALARAARGFHASKDRCTHRGGSLAGGVLIGDAVQCLWHGSQFNVRTGAPVCGPAETGIQLIPVRVENHHVLLQIPK